MLPKILVLHLPPTWLPETKSLALEIASDAGPMLAVMPVEALRRRFKTRPDLSGLEAVTVFTTFAQNIEDDIRALLDRHGPPPAQDRGPGPLVLNLAARGGPWCLPTRAAAAGVPS